jgi:hypothetical protein
MKDPLAAKAVVGKFEEVKELVRTVYLRAGDTDYRLEIYRHYTNPQTPYVVSYFVGHKIPHPNPKFQGRTIDAFFVDSSLPWAHGTSPEQALARALDFLQDRHRTGSGVGAVTPSSV